MNGIAATGCDILFRPTSLRLKDGNHVAAEGSGSRYTFYRGAQSVCAREPERGWPKLSPSLPT
jgi:hypothetical protein